MNIAIILASGVGKRMQSDVNKTLMLLEGKPVVHHAIMQFQEAKDIDGILIVCRDESKDEFAELVETAKFSKVIDIIEGGKERQDSGFNAISYLLELMDNKFHDKAIVLFHNGANPFVSAEEIKESINAAREYGASVVAHPTKDTVKSVSDDGMVEETLERRKLWNMQTPQTIQFELAKEAFFSAKDANFTGTDDVSLVERLGRQVKIVPASEFNFKLTTPIDLELAKIIIKKLNHK